MYVTINFLSCFNVDKAYLLDATWRVFELGLEVQAWHDGLCNNRRKHFIFIAQRAPYAKGTSLHTAGAPKFKLTNRDSEDGKLLCPDVNVNGKRIAVRQLFSLETARNIHENGFIVQKTYQISKSEKCETFCLQAFNYLAPKMGRPRPATCSEFVECRQVVTWLIS